MARVSVSGDKSLLILLDSAKTYHNSTSASKIKHLLSLNDLNSEMRVSSWGQGGEKYVGDH